MSDIQVRMDSASTEIVKEGRGAGITSIAVLTAASASTALSSERFVKVVLCGGSQMIPVTFTENPPKGFVARGSTKSAVSVRKPQFSNIVSCGLLGDPFISEFCRGAGEGGVKSQVGKRKHSDIKKTSNDPPRIPSIELLLIEAPKSLLASAAAPLARKKYGR